MASTSQSKRTGTISCTCRPVTMDALSYSHLAGLTVGYPCSRTKYSTFPKPKLSVKGNGTYGTQRLPLLLACKSIPSKPPLLLANLHQVSLSSDTAVNNEILRHLQLRNLYSSSAKLYRCDYRNPSSNGQTA